MLEKIQALLVNWRRRKREMDLERKIFLVDKEIKSPSENLAINKYYVSLVKEGKYDLITRVYSHSNGIILGYNESINDVYMDFCNKNRHEVVRRFTGGSAVVVDPETSLSYTLIFNPENLGMRKDITMLYKKITIPLAKNLGKNVTVEVTYYLRIRRNGYSVPFAGHAINMHDGDVVQFDGIINRTSFDTDHLSRVLKLRELYLLNGVKYIKSDGKIYDLKGSQVNLLNLKQANLLRSEIDELKKVQGLKEIGIDDSKFIDLFRKTIKDVFGEVTERHIQINQSSLSLLQREIKNNTKGGTKAGLGHCYIDFLEPEPRIHYD